MQPTPIWLTLLSIFLSGAVSALTTVFLNLRQAERVLCRSKLEELCGILLDLKSHMLKRHALVAGGSRDEAAKLPDPDVFRNYRVHILMSLYVPRGVDAVMAAMKLPVGLAKEAQMSDEELVAALKEVIDSYSRAYTAALSQADALNSWKYFLRLRN